MCPFKNRLLRAEDDFLTALAKGESAIFDFERGWEQLLNDIDSATAAAILDSEIPPLAHTVAVRIAALADTSAALLEKCDDATSQLVNEIDLLMSQITLDEPLPFNNTFPSRKEVSTSRKRRRSTSPGLVAITNPKKRRRDTPLDESKSPSFSNVAPHKSASVPPEYQAPKRKRRLSDLEPLSSPMGCKRLYLGPRVHAVSDTYCLSHTSDREWKATEAPLSNPQSFEPVDLCTPALPIEPIHKATQVEVVCDASLLPNHDDGPSSGDIALDNFLDLFLDANIPPVALISSTFDPDTSGLIPYFPTMSDSHLESSSPFSSPASSPYPLTPILGVTLEPLSPVDSIYTPFQGDPFSLEHDPCTDESQSCKTFISPLPFNPMETASQDVDWASVLVPPSPLPAPLPLHCLPLDGPDLAALTALDEEWFFRSSTESLFDMGNLQCVYEPAVSKAGLESVFPA